MESVDYKPSRELHYEQREREMQRVGIVPGAHLAVEDFKGLIDGAGVKNVMVSPKTPLELIPPQFLEGLAGVLLHGKQKYAANNWMRGMSWSTVFGGVMRHAWAWYRGERLDPESGRPHLFHMACGLMFLTWYEEGPQAEEHRKLDDRVFKVTPNA